MAGFEGSDHVNGFGVPLDINARNGHTARLAEDYAALRSLGITTVRESVGWRLTQAGGDAALAWIAAQAGHAARHGIQVIWTLMHYGWPPGLDPFVDPDGFVQAFGEHCGRVARTIAAAGAAAPPIWQPVNEISFLSWAASQTGLIHPHTPTGPENGVHLKRVLVRSAIRAMDEIRRLDPEARFVHTDPLVYVAPPLGAGPQACDAARRVHQAQYQSWDMLCGQEAPELGGGPAYLDILGINYYHDNQWDHGSGARLHWHEKDPRRRSFAALAEDTHQRYARPLCLSETGHVGEGRDAWLDDMGRELLDCRNRGVPISGICLYPAIDRPDWQTADHWHHSGLWDVPGADQGDFTRRLCLPYARRIRHWQQALSAPCATLHPIPPSIPQSTPPMTSLIVFSHLRWDFVYQRPQQLVSRLAADRPVIFVEEPIPGAAESRLESYTPCEGVTVLRMHLPSHGAGFHDAHMGAMREMLGRWLADHRVDAYLLWFYTPMALPLAEGLAPLGMVYDCMDELAAFDFAPPELLAREKALFGKVDLVFTGGRSLYESKRLQHPDVHCFPSSVDHAHFGRRGLADHPDQAALPHPRLGYYGVIDERIDLSLVAALADAHAEWQIVMVGPLAKIPSESLPRRPNLHWMGQRRYDELPSFLAGWDVCLMPFAMNASTRFISPTKTLEYLVAGKAVVSTPIRDVVHQYAGVVPIVSDAAELVATCETLLARTPAEIAAFEVKAADAVSATSWDRTAAAMRSLLLDLERSRAGSRTRDTAVPAAPVHRALPSPVSIA